MITNWDYQNFKGLEKRTAWREGKELGSILSYDGDFEARKAGKDKRKFDSLEKATAYIESNAES